MTRLTDRRSGLRLPAVKTRATLRGSRGKNMFDTFDRNQSEEGVQLTMRTLRRVSCATTPSLLLSSCSATR